MRLRVGLISRTFFNVPVWAAIDRGFFSDVGLDIDAAILDSGTAVTAGMRSGDIKFSLGPPDGVLQDREQNGALRIIAGNTSKLSHFLITQSRFKRIEDLKGARIGCLSPDEGTTFVIQDMLARHGLAYPGDYELAIVGGAPTRWKLLQEGSIDAGLQSIPLSYMAEDAGFSNLAATTDYIPDYQFTTINTDGAWAGQNREVAVSFLAALSRATRWVFDHSDGCAEIAAREMNISHAYGLRAWEDFTGRGIMPEDMTISDAGIATVARLMARGGMLGGAAASDPGPAIDRSYLEQARNVT
ncbi:MAG: ABC transporter substrate-binding protein [Hyphomicrobiaceae bacterium]